MIKTTYSAISSVEFTMTLQKISTLPMGTKLAYDFGKLLVKLQAARDMINKDFEKDLIQKYAVRDDAGEIVRPEKKGPQGFEVKPEMKADFDTAQEDFGKRELTIERMPIAVSRLMTLNLSPLDMIQLEPILFDDDAALSNVVSISGSAPENA